MRQIEDAMKMHRLDKMLQMLLRSAAPDGNEER